MRRDPALGLLPQVGRGFPIRSTGGERTRCGSLRAENAQGRPSLSAIPRALELPTLATNEPALGSASLALVRGEVGSKAARLVRRRKLGVRL